MITTYTKTLDDLKKRVYTNKNSIHGTERFLKENKHCTQKQNAQSHICTFFVPIHIPSHSIYFVHHIKAQSWIPPGGHIEQGEDPLHTVIREFGEELGKKVEAKNIDLFDLTITHIENSKQRCKTHYDFWYVVRCNSKEPFSFLKDEFYAADWFPIDEAISKTQHDTVLSILPKIKHAYFEV